MSRKKHLKKTLECREKELWKNKKRKRNVIKRKHMASKEDEAGKCGCYKEGRNFKRKRKEEREGSLKGRPPGGGVQVKEDQCFNNMISTLRFLSYFCHLFIGGNISFFLSSLPLCHSLPPCFLPLLWLHYLILYISLSHRYLPGFHFPRLMSTNPTSVSPSANTPCLPCHVCVCMCLR